MGGWGGREMEFISPLFVCLMALCHSPGISNTLRNCKKNKKSINNFKNDMIKLCEHAHKNWMVYQSKRTMICLFWAVSPISLYPRFSILIPLLTEFKIQNFEKTVIIDYIPVQCICICTQGKWQVLIGQLPKDSVALFCTFLLLYKPNCIGKTVYLSSTQSVHRHAHHVHWRIHWCVIHCTLYR